MRLSSVNAMLPLVQRLHAIPEADAVVFPYRLARLVARVPTWIQGRQMKVTPVMELDSFDLIINLVASGFGLALVPRRALALYRRKESIATLPLEEPFEREIVTLTRKHRRLPPHVKQFVRCILF